MGLPFRPPASMEDVGANFEALPRFQWAALPYRHSYADYASGGFQVGQFTRDALGIVRLRGLVKKPSAWAAGDVMATLPPGFRPAAAEVFAGFAFDNTAGGFVARIDVYPDGSMLLGGSAPAVATPAALSYLSLAGITFKQGG